MGEALKELADQQATIAELEDKIVELSRELDERDTELETDCLFTALAKAQGEFPEIKKDKTATVKTRNGGEYSYSYASLDAVLSAVRPVLSRHGIAISWIFESGERNGFVITQLLYRHETHESRIPTFADTDMQSLGSAITYAKRYGLCGLIGVTAEEDDDGAAAGTSAAQTRSSRRERPAVTSPSPSGEVGTPPLTNGLGEPVSPPPQPAPDPTDFETWQTAIDRLTKQETVAALVKRAKEIEAVRTNPQLCKRIFDALYSRYEILVRDPGNQEWADDATEQADAALFELQQLTKPQTQGALNYDT